MNQSIKQARSGYTLMEMLVASASASLLIGGMTSSIFISSQALDLADGSSGSATSRSHTARDLDQLTKDLRHALQFTERTATAMTFTVPDRTGDGLPEVIRYAWSGVSGAPITYTLNGVSGNALLTSVTSVDFSYITVVIPPTGGS